MARIVVITPAAPIMTADDAKSGMPGLAGMADDVLAALIEAATEELDGPTGWLGRAIGRQTLMLTLDGFSCDTRRGIELPLPPVASISSVKFDDANGEVTLDPSEYALDGSRLIPADGAWPWLGVRQGGGPRITYVAGYDPVPSRIKVAVQLRVGELAQQMGRDSTLKKEVVEGVGSFEYDVASGAARSATSRAVEQLLGGLRVMGL